MAGMEHAACGGVDAWGFRYLKYAPTFHQINKYKSKPTRMVDGS
ncbi:MAG: hypothetical protein Q7J10_00875 [Methanosarcinaceae archaeon]|nr:hypothetical protein [Methanosarcinaceae archaeon]